MTTDLGRPADWYKDAIVYEAHVKAFADSNDDGTGDFAGLTARLDYLQDLGVTAVWVLPFYPSPLRDDGYDIADYTGIHPRYGAMRDFRAFLREAHRRELRVITELVINHTSDQHPWFQRARRAAPGSRWRNFYVWSSTGEEYPDARIIFRDTETSNWAWDPVANAFYWHRFFSHQPDLNFDNAEVRRHILNLVSYWLEMGVDGLRLDAVPYLFEEEGTMCENLPPTHEFLKELRHLVDDRFPGRMLLAEANQWPEHAAEYFGDGDECHMAFHFPLMPRLYMAIRREDRLPLVDILEQTPPIPPTAQWALFLRNHDELTLEMVTDDEREYMYRVYAEDPRARLNLGIRRRLAPLLDNDRRAIELMCGLIFSLPGTPVLYYGDEIGMGDNIYLDDRNGVRTPMQWSGDRNAGFSRASPQQLYLPVITDPEYHYATVNVEAQQDNPQSLLSWMKRIISLRKQSPVFGRGDLEMLHPANESILAYLRRLGDERVLVVANLSPRHQFVELDLSRFSGVQPVEVVAGSEFPTIGELPYLLTLGPYAFYWFSLGIAGPIDATTDLPLSAPTVPVAQAHPNAIFEGAARPAIVRLLARHLREREWFSGGTITSAVLEEVIAVPLEPGMAHIALITINTPERGPQTYTMPIRAAFGADGQQLRHNHPHALIADLTVLGSDETGVVIDGFADPVLPDALWRATASRRRLRGERGEVVTRPTSVLRAAVAEFSQPPQVVPTSDTSAKVGDTLDMALARRYEAGVHADIEVRRFLTDRARFAHVPAIAGTLELRLEGKDAGILGIIEEVDPSWRRAGRVAAEHVAATLAADDQLPEPPSLIEGSDTVPEGVWATAAVLGRRTADLHAALASDAEDPGFAPGSLTTLDQRSLYQAMRGNARRVLRAAWRELRRFDPATAHQLQRLIDGEQQLLQAFAPLRDDPVVARRIRVHGDLRLDRILLAGDDILFTGFGREPGLSGPERRIKRAPIQDVAALLHSIADVAHGQLEQAGLDRFGGAACRWHHWAAAALLGAYRTETGPGILPPAAALDALLRAFLVDRAMTMLGRALEARPERAWIPLRGALEWLEWET